MSSNRCSAVVLVADCDGDGEGGGVGGGALVLEAAEAGAGVLEVCSQNVGPAKVLAGGGGASFTFGSNKFANDPPPMLTLGFGPGSY